MCIVWIKPLFYKQDYKQQVIQYISDNLYESSLFFTPTIGSFLRIFFDLDVVNIESNLIKKLSIKSSNHHIGISLLEKQLCLGDTSENSKRFINTIKYIPITSCKYRFKTKKKNWFSNSNFKRKRKMDWSFSTVQGYWWTQSISQHLSKLRGDLRYS